MSNVTPIRPDPATPEQKRLPPAEIQTLVRRAKAVVDGVRSCIDHDEDVSADALELAEEILDSVYDALDGVVLKEAPPTA